MNVAVGSPDLLRFGFRDDPGLVDLVTHAIAADRRQLELEVPDMRCANCAGRIERALVGLDGVLEVRINPVRHHVVLDFDPSRIGLSALLGAVSAAGYTPIFSARPDDDPRLVAERRSSLKRVGVAGIAMMQVMMFSLALYAGEFAGMSDFYDTVFRWSALIFTTPVVLFSAAPFFSNALQSLRATFRAAPRENPTSIGLAMDVPVALAIGVAFIASLAATLTGQGHVYFDSITMFTFLLLGARYLEQSTRHRLARFDNWLALLPESVSRLGDDGVTVETVPLAGIRVDDRIIIAAGSRVPVDGQLLEGLSRIDESALTGESRLVDKGPGEQVFAGTLNVAQPMTVRVSARPIETRMAEIHRLAQRATLTKPGTVVLADTIARHFVSAVLLIAFITYVAWHFVDPAAALGVTISVLVVSCPCALSLATPTAITAAATALRRIGFVITRAHVLERLARIDHVVFDKTGTLTGGEVQLMAVEPLGALSKDACISIARALESRTIHPLADVFGQTNPTRHAVSDVRIYNGRGIEGCIDGVPYRLGSAEFCGIAQRSRHPELTSFYLVRAPVVSGTSMPALAEFGVRATLRDDVAATIDALRRLGVTCEIVTGDGSMPTAALSRELGGIPFRAEVTPEAKLAHIETLRAAGAQVAMVGDGINDVPGLAAAAVSITPADGTDLAKSASDALLLAPGVGSMARAVAVARRARRIIRQNVGWAVVYNLTAIPLAIAGFVPPWLAAIGMSASSLGVTLNAMRLGVTEEVRPWKSS